MRIPLLSRRRSDAALLADLDAAERALAGSFGEETCVRAERHVALWHIRQARARLEADGGWLGLFQARRAIEEAGTGTEEAYE